MQRFEMEFGVGFVTRWAPGRNNASRVVGMPIAESRFIRSLYKVHEQGRPLPRIVRSLRDHVLETYVDALVPEFAERRKRGRRVYKDAVSASETAAFSAVFLRER